MISTAPNSSAGSLSIYRAMRSVYFELESMQLSTARSYVTSSRIMSCPTSSEVNSDVPNGNFDLSVIKHIRQLENPHYCYTCTLTRAPWRRFAALMGSWVQGTTDYEVTDSEHGNDNEIPKVFNAVSRLLNGGCPMSSRSDITHPNGTECQLRGFAF